MTLPPLSLDDLTFEEMVAAIRNRIPGESDGRWTLHAPVDPGVTLLELFAALLEQRLYWLDQIPDAVVTAVLRLLGLPTLAPARPAGTVLRAFVRRGTTPPSDAPWVADGTAFTRDPAGDVVFTIERPITLLPVRAVRLLADGRDLGPDLAAGRAVAVLPADGGPGTLGIELAMPAPTCPWPEARISLLLDVEAVELDSEAEEGVPPHWSPEAVPDVPPPATVQWWYEHPGGPSPFDPADVEDGTQGLRRAGVVRLRYPDAWRAFPQETERWHGLLLRTDAATFSAPPRLRRLEVNVAPARHHQTFWPTPAERAGLTKQITRWLPLPGQHLELPQAADRLLGGELELRERGGGRHRWTATPDLTFHGRGDRVFVVDRAAGALRFGDGRTGRIPVPDRDSPLVRARWEVGGGAAANGGTTPNWLALEQTWLAAANPVPVIGGLDPETVAQARVRAAAALRIPHRAVTPADHREIVLRTPGVPVARAHVQVGAHPGHPCRVVPGAVSVRVVPTVPRAADDWTRPDFVAAPVPDPGMRRAVCDRLAAARLAGSELFLRELRYRTVWLRVDLAGAPAGGPVAVPARIRDGLRRFLDPLVGGADGAGWPFGEPLRPSALLRVAQRACDSDAEVVAVAVRLHGDGVWESCLDVPILADELVELIDVRVRVVGAGALR